MVRESYTQIHLTKDEIEAIENIRKAIENGELKPLETRIIQGTECARGSHPGLIPFFGYDTIGYLPKIDGKYVMAGNKLEYRETKKCYRCSKQLHIIPKLKEFDHICYDCIKATEFPHITIVDIDLKYKYKIDGILELSNVGIHRTYAGKPIAIEYNWQIGESVYIYGINNKNNILYGAVLLKTKKEEPKVESIEPKEEPKVESIEPKEEPKVESIEPKEESKVESIKPKEEPKVESIKPKEEPKVESIKPKEEPKVEIKEEPKVKLKKIELEKFIDDLRNRHNTHDVNLSEVETRRSIIDKVLFLLGWNIFDPEEVNVTYTIEAEKIYKPDYKLEIRDFKAIIEAKKVKTTLDIHQEQLLNYSYLEGVNIAILTNGLIWQFYVGTSNEHWEQRRFVTINFLEQDPKDAVSRLIEFLSRENALSGNAVANYSSAYSGMKRIRKLQKAIPKALNDAFNNCDPRLINTLCDITENLSGYRPNEDEMKFVLNLYKGQFYIKDKQVKLPE